MTEIKTAEGLLQSLKSAASRESSAAELNEQRISFIMGSINEHTGVTREKVKEILNAQEGRKA